MPIYIYKGNHKVSTNAIRNTKVVKAIYAKEQGQGAVCIWGIDRSIPYDQMFTYSSDNSMVRITGLKPEVKSVYITIPDTISNKKVVSIVESAFKGKNKIVSMIVSDSVAGIGRSAFQDCSSLKSITIPFVGKDTLARFGFDQMFGYIFGWTNYKTSGATLQYSEGTKDYYYFIPPSLKSVTVTGGEIFNAAFNNCKGLTSVTLGNGVTKIDFRAFDGCTGLTNITVSDSVTSIDSLAFRNTAWYDNQPDGLVYAGKVAYKYKGIMPENTSIVLEEGTLGIASSAFEGYTDLTSITIPDSVTNIGRYAFKNCSGLTSVTIPNSVTSIGDYAFGYCSGLISITIPDSVTSIGFYAFDGCTGLTSITIPDSVTSIGKDAFRNTAWYDNQPDGLVYAGKVVYAYKGTMPSNTSIELKEGTLGIADYAFDGCTGLTSITIPDSVTSISNHAFDDCTGLTSVTIGNGVTSIGDYAFGYCSGLISITFNGTKTQWNRIIKGLNWNINTGNYKIHCTDGDISK